MSKRKFFIPITINPVYLGESFPGFATAFPGFQAQQAFLFLILADIVK